jgi:hypothetical protein
MNPQSLNTKLLLLLAFVCGGVQPLRAQADADAEFVARMKERAPSLAKILRAEKAGEGLQALVLSLPEGSSKAALTAEDKTVIDAENQDRKALFTSIAANTGVASSRLAALRAEQIRAILKKQHTAWFQEPDARQSEGFHWVSPSKHGPSGEDERGSFVWTKPGAAIYSTPGSSTSVDDNVPGFSSYYVLRTEAAADGKWFNVGLLPPIGSTTDPKNLGWMHERDVLPQPHRLVVSFANDANRDKMAIFSKKEDLVALTRKPADQRAAEYDRLWKEARQKERPSDFPLVAVEPDVAPEIFKTFYVMPVLKAEPTMIDTEPATIVNLASATLKSSGAVKMETFDMDVVFVIDTTGSMQPFIDEVVAMCQRMANSITDSKARFRFGCWGYQDIETKPGIQYLTRNFTKSLLPLDQFTKEIGQVKANVPTEDEYAEAVLDGVVDAVSKTNWSGANAARLIVLVGDAPPLPRSFRGSFDGRENMDLSGVRQTADEQRVSIIAINIQDPKHKSDKENPHATAAREFSKLSTNRGSAGNASFFPVPGDGVAAFGGSVGSLIKAIVFRIREQVGESAQLPQISKEDLEKVDFMLKPLVRDVLSRRQNEQAPSFQTGWALSKGFKKTNRPVFEVCLFATHAELDTCVSNLQRLIEVGKSGKLDNKELYEDVQRLVRRIFYPGVDDITADLPYRSTLLETPFEELIKKDSYEWKEFWSIVDAKVNGLREKLAQPKSIFGPTYRNAPKDEWVTAISKDGIP